MLYSSTYKINIWRTNKQQTTPNRITYTATRIHGTSLGDRISTISIHQDTNLKASDQHNDSSYISKDTPYSQDYITRESETEERL